MKHLRTLFDLSPEDVRAVLKLTADLKRRWAAGDRDESFACRTLALVFEKPSLRTRISFEVAATQLGGSSVCMSVEDAGLSGRESLADVARVLSSYCDVVALRTFSQDLIEKFAEHATCPVINALSDDRHPCQALTDLFTIQEAFGELAGRHLVYVGDGNNVAASLMIAAAMTGMRMTVAAPDGYRVDEALVAEVGHRHPDQRFQQVDDPVAAVVDADVVYTDVWASMGQEAEAAERREVFQTYQVNRALMDRAPASCRFMHDLPARRGMEVTDDVMECDASIVFQQAENRMHLAKGLLAWMLKG